MAGSLPNELTGAFIEVAQVTNFGTVDEAETIVGSTTSDVSITNNQDRAETEKHSQRRRVSKPTYNDVELEVPWLLTPGAPQLEEFGIVDSNGEEQYAVAWEAARIHVYDQEGDSSPAQTFEFEDTEWDFSDLTLGSDFAEGSVTGIVHGAWRRGQS